MENSAGEKFARVGEANDYYFLTLTQSTGIGISFGNYTKAQANAFCDAINSAFSSAVKERVEEAVLEREKVLYSWAADEVNRKVREAEDRVWEEAARIAEDNECSDDCTFLVHETHNNGCPKGIASALRARRSK